MAKRKTTKKPTVKKVQPLGTVFKCLFCHHDKAVSVKLDKQAMFGHLTCKTCGQNYQTPINNLSVAVDVYYDWVDACEEVREKQPKKQRAPKGPDPLTHGAQGGVVISSLGERNEGDDEDAEGEDDPDLEVDREITRKKAPRGLDGDLDEDEDGAEVDRVDKRRRVEVEDPDDDDDDDDDEDD